jgi:hypothetical protein
MSHKRIEPNGRISQSLTASGSRQPLYRSSRGDGRSFTNDVFGGRRPLRWRFSKFNGVVACVVSCWSLVISSTTVLPSVWALVDYIWKWTTSGLQPNLGSVSRQNGFRRAIDIACYPASTFRGLPPKRPFVRELAALR